MNRYCWLILMLYVVPAAGAGEAADEAQSRTVIGPRNPDLAAGADALLAGDAKEGIRLTKLGLGVAQGRREHQAAFANLCAGHVMLGDYETALDYCDQALAVNQRNWRALCNRALAYVRLGRYGEASADLDLAQAIAPNATALKEVRGLLLDATDPVRPSVTIDDRREAAGDDAD
jgi:tetratricopeptide (TPR) repeat protein